MRSYSSLAEIQRELSENRLTCVDLTQTYLQRIEAQKELNAFLEVFDEEALERAATIDQKLANGEAGKLAGMVIALKDNICYRGHKVSAASHILEGFESLYSATVVERLLAEDAIIIGRTNCDEFAMGSSNENSAFGNVLNPLDHSKVPGGSSGGSIVAVAADLCLVALGSETGGSIRLPASFCGVVGVKPSYGRVSRYGLIAFASSFDQIGPVGKSVEDVALVMEVMSGRDERDNTSSSAPVPQASKVSEDLPKMRIGYARNAIESKGVDPEVKQMISDLADKLRAEGHEVEDVEVPLLDYLVPTYTVLTTAEASSNLSRFDGIHYGYRSEASTDIPSTLKRSRTEGFGAEVKRRIMLGTFVLSAGYYDAYYSKAQKVRRIIRDETSKIFENHDLVLLPTAPHTAFDIGANTEDPVAMYLEDIFTVQANLAGVPAISIPWGTHSNGMPVGMQLMGKKFDEERLFAFARQVMNMN